MLLCFLSFVPLNAQSILGAWETQTATKEGQQIKGVVIFSKRYLVVTWYQAKTGEFLGTNGGKWVLNGNTVTETVEFDTDNSASVGQQLSFAIRFSDTEMEIEGMPMKWKRIDNGAPGALAGAWLMSGKKSGDVIQSRDTNQPRKTMKILSGTRFQWIAYNTETKKFMGTGGGTYTTIDGKYTENIEFFSKDNSRVGASLTFDYSLKDGDWNHSGFSSKGAPLFEIWSIRK